eukprot:6599411-Pyramimonas_sp.AAC.2
MAIGDTAPLQSHGCRKPPKCSAFRCCPQDPAVHVSGLLDIRLEDKLVVGSLDQLRSSRRPASTLWLPDLLAEEVLLLHGDAAHGRGGHLNSQCRLRSKHCLWVAQTTAPYVSIVVHALLTLLTLLADGRDNAINGELISNQVPANLKYLELRLIEIKYQATPCHAHALKYIQTRLKLFVPRCANVVPHGVTKVRNSSSLL